MAAYTSSNGRFGSLNGRDKARFRFQSWTATDDSDGFTKYEARSDHVCRPVIIGSDGKATPAVFDCPPGHQHHHDGGVVTGIGGNGRWQQSEQSGDAYRADPYKAQGYVSSVQTAADGRFPLPGGRFQREKVSDFYSDDDASYNWSRRPSVEPQVAVSNGGGWARDGRTAGWGAPPPPVGALGRVTNDIGAATEFIRESGFPAAQATDRWISQAPASMYQPNVRKKSAGNVIDSKEAAKKYGGQFIW